MAIDESKNKRAEKIVGKRGPINAIIVNTPAGEGFHCPVCKYDVEKHGYYDERLDWSEYNGFLWCSVCNKDYPSCLCMPKIDKAIDIYLSCIEDLTKQTSGEGTIGSGSRAAPEHRDIV
jgi:hypothetical protein